MNSLLTNEELRILRGLERGKELHVGLAGARGIAASFLREGDRHDQVGDRVDIRALNALVARGLLDLDLSRVDFSVRSLRGMPLYLTCQSDQVTNAGTEALRTGMALNTDRFEARALRELVLEVSG